MPLVILALWLSMGFFGPLIKVSAAPAACYVGANSNFRTATCEITNQRHAYFDSAGNRLTALPDDTCYQQDTAVVGGVRYNQTDCAVMTAFANAVAADAPNLCTASGGDPNITGTADNGSFSCTCPDGQVYSSTSRQCTTPGGAPSSSDSIPKADGPETDCNEGAGDLTEDNCKIVGLLNTVFNFVSGGIALAVIGNIIYAGIQYSMAQGDPSAVGKSKNRIRGALVAFLMYISLYAFLQWLIPGGVF